MTAAPRCGGMRSTNPSSAWAYDDPRVAELVLANAREYAIIILTDEGAIASWSPGAEAIFGYGPDEILGKHVSILFVPSDVAAGAPELELDVARTQGRAEDSRWHVRKDGERFWGNGVAMRLQHGGPSGFLKILRDETTSKLADEQRVLLLNELNHRIKNTLATVQSLAEQTLRSSSVDASARKNLTERLLALSQAHDVLVQENWAGADLRAILERSLGAHLGGAPNQWRLEGPSIRLSPQQAVSISLAIHELATNALKYGAISTPTGCVEVTWNLAQDGNGRRFMNLLWSERGGPRVHTPESTGFGTRLLTQSFGRESGGKATVEYLSDGLRCVLDLPLSEAEEASILDLGAERARREG